MEGTVKRSYTIPESVSRNPIKWLIWLHYDDSQLPQGSVSFQTDNCRCFHNCSDKWERFVCAYKWNTRNSMYNINYNYMSNQSPIISHHKSFGDYEWDRKLRRRYGDIGSQLVWFTTEKDQYRFLFSMAKIWFKKDITFYIGWNASFNGRFTLGLKVK